MILLKKKIQFSSKAQVVSFRLLQRPLSIELYGMLEMRLSVIYGVTLKRTIPHQGTIFRRSAE